MPEAARDGYNSRLVCEGLSPEYLEPVNRPDKVAVNSQPSTVRQCTEFSVFEATSKDTVAHVLLLLIYIVLNRYVIYYSGPAANRKVCSRPFD